VDGCEEPAPPGRGEARGSRARGRLPRARRPSCRRGPAAREPSCAALTLRRRRGAGGAPSNPPVPRAGRLERPGVRGEDAEDEEGCPLSLMVFRV
jgi:hypothetical protein